MENRTDNMNGNGNENFNRTATTAVSEKMREANRRTCLKSTGPRTPEGRAVSRMNALKHGLASKEVLVRGSAGRESGRELAKWHERFHTQLKPVGPIEELLVDQISDVAHGGCAGC